MIIHFLIMLGLLVAAFLERKYRNDGKIFILFSFFLLFILTAFRSYNIGNDTKEYLRIFQLAVESDSLKTLMSKTRYETGYLFFNYIISRITRNFTWILVIISMFYLGSVFWFIKKYAKSIEVAVLLFFTYSMYYNAFNTMRQCISIGIFLIAIPFLENKKYIRYCLLIVIATTFHQMSILMIALCFVPEINFSKDRHILRYGILALMALVVLSFGVKYVMGYFPYLAHYLVDSKYSQGGVRIASVIFLFMRLSVVFILFLIGAFGYQKDNFDNRVAIFNKFILIDCLIAAASIGFNMYDRIEDYFCIGFLVAIVNIIETVCYKSNKVIIYVTMILMSFLYLTATLLFRNSWIGIYPYQFIKW